MPADKLPKKKGGRKKIGPVIRLLFRKVEYQTHDEFLFAMQGKRKKGKRKGHKEAKVPRSSFKGL